MDSAVLDRGRKALAAWAWDEARTAFIEALDNGETPEALEGLGTAAVWLDDGPAAIDAHIRAYRLYRDRGDDLGAARAALAVADSLLTFRGEAPTASGWLQRARAFVEEKESPLLAWIEFLEAHIAMAYARDIGRATHLAEGAVALARKVGDRDTEMLARSLLGFVLVSSGRFTDGVTLLDEAAAAAVAGDVQDPHTAASVCCVVVTAGVRTRDLARLGEWSKHAMRFSRATPDRELFAYPRIERALALIWWGRWAEAERELTDAISDTEGRPRVAGLGMLRLAELRRRQGELAAATALLNTLSGSAIGVGHSTYAVEAAVSFDRGDPERAIELAERYLRAVPGDDLVERVDGLEVLVRASLALDRVDRADQAATELAAIANRVPTGLVAAAALAASGTVAWAQEDTGAARAHLESAVRLYRECAAPLEEGRARLDLARVLAWTGRTQLAIEEAERALATLDGIHARLHVAETRRFLASLRPPARGHTLTAREIEVLQLVASGHTNEEIAAELVLSVRTVERHVSNIYAKIGAHGAAGRAMAAAYAHTHALV